MATTSSTSRMTGLTSGWDTDTMVKNLMKSDQSKLDKLNQARQTADWQKDKYKEFSTLLRSIQSEFMDVLNPTKNLRGKTMYNVYNATATVAGAASTAVTVTTTSSSQKGTIKIDRIDRLATADTWTSTGEMATLKGSAAVDMTALQSALTAGNNKMTFSFDGVSKSINLESTYADAAALQSDLQTKLNTTFGSGNITVGLNSGTLDFSSTGHTLFYASENASLTSALKLTDGAGNALLTSSTLANAFGVSDSDLNFTINGITSATMGIKSTDTIQQMMTKINSSSAGVTLSYSSISDTFTLKSNKEGVANSITKSGSFLLDKLKLGDSGHTSAVDAQVTINGVSTTRATNTFAVDGTSIKLNALQTSGAISIDIATNPDDVIKTIKEFAVKYNELIDKINTTVTEKHTRSYTPLTDAQKEAMTETQITQWETKAKKGLLRSDSILNNIRDQLRTALSEATSGVGISLKDIGISTSSDYTTNGKLVIDDTKLKAALKERPTEVIQLFTQESTTLSTDTANASTRYKENGWMNRINDIFQNNIKLTGTKGVLIEKAGYELNDAETTSTIAKQISKYDTQISDLMANMLKKENAYYSRFAQMESTLQKLQAQASNLTGK